jgi:predicted nucleic acid-binding protein
MPGAEAKVVDASALGALLFGEPESDRIARRLADGRLIAPALLPFEVANVCLTKMRRHAAARDALLAAFDLYAQLRIETAAIDHAAALILAESAGLTAYDASYLWLARAAGADLVTLDRRLAAAYAESNGG